MPKLMQSCWLSRCFLVVVTALMSGMPFGEARASEGVRWRWSHPEPHGNNIKDMARSESTGLWVQVAELGTLYTSFDGFTWRQRETGTRKALRSVTFFGKRMVVTGEAGTVLFADSEYEIEAGVLLDGPTEDWLEGVTAGGDRLVAVGDNGSVYTSMDGVEWSVGSSGVTNWLRDVAYDGSRFVAVGEDGTVLSSENGLQWSAQASPVEEHLTAVAVLSPGFLVAGDNGTVLLSEDGAAWQCVDVGETNDLYTVAATGLDALVAGDRAIRVRVEGQWRDESTGPNRPVDGAYYASLGLLDSVFLGGYAGMMIEGFRVGDGAYEWYWRTTPDRPWLFDLASTSNLFVTVGDQSTVMTSLDGITWAFEIPPTTFPNSVFLGVGGTTNFLVAAGSEGSLMTSTNDWIDVGFTNAAGLVEVVPVSTLGIIWSAVDLPQITEDLQGVCFWEGRYYVTGGSGTLLCTDDGTTWVDAKLPTENFLSGIAGYPGGLVVVGDNGALFQSADGTTWTNHSLSQSDWVYRVRSVNGQLVAVGQGGLLITSQDGTVWTPRDSGTTNWLTDVTWANGAFYVTGLAGTVLRSEDAEVWQNGGAITRKALMGVAADSERLVVVGAEGVVLRSPVLQPSLPVEILQFSRALDSEQENWEHIYLLGGSIDQQFTLDRREALDDQPWINGRLLEITDGPGTLLYLERVPVSEAPPTEFYGTTPVP